jgi:hypothetical protein
MPVLDLLHEDIQRLPRLLGCEHGVRARPRDHPQEFLRRDPGYFACLPPRLPAEIQKSLQMHAPPIQRLLRRSEAPPLRHAAHPRLGMDRLALRLHRRRLAVRLHRAMVCHHGIIRHFFLKPPGYRELILAKHR